ncbi:MAG: hypothetical protein JRI23_35635 [Deltaproteobacteria bacterium]|nr:hypothetical protein [Deltaproteobacteria bacterium]MBW2537663.1 hypothetical protein [Deltaproteobacteria bacterium]
MSVLAWSPLRPLAAAALLAAATGCAAAKPQVITTPEQGPSERTEAASEEGDELPKALRGLGLSRSQRGEIRRLRDELEPRLEPLRDGGRDYALALAKVARQCDPEGKALEDAGSWVVVVGEDLRGPILDAVDRVHHILTPAQRKALSSRLLGRERERDPEAKDEEGIRSVAAELDLSLSQIMSLLVRAQLLRDAAEERVEPWRIRYENALRAFPEEDFSIREHPIAEVPAAALATRFVRDGVRLLLPILEPAQCAALADFIEAKVEEAAEPDRK